MLNGPPGDYDRKVEFQVNWVDRTTYLRELAGEHTRGGGCGSIGFNAGNLTRNDSRMRVSLKGLPDKLRGAAWPSSARTVRRAVKSVKLTKSEKILFGKK